MGAKRALIVDDSKSARLFLARVLEKYDIDVDCAESAEAAIDYLVSNRPDVIFMDHLMPGMDGLQAVQQIKNDPRTATIPIMMYTSQEGELYLGQARALGAIGVLPKQIKPTDVSKVLYELHLVPDRRTPEQSSFTALNVRLEAGTPEAASGAALQAPHRQHAARALRGAAPRAGRGRRHPDRSHHRRGARVAARVAARRLRAAEPRWRATREPRRASRALRGLDRRGRGARHRAASSALWWRSERLLGAARGRVGQLQAHGASARSCPCPPRPAAAPAALDRAARRRPPPSRSWCRCPTAASRWGVRDWRSSRQHLYRLAASKVTAQLRTSGPSQAATASLGNAVEGYSPGARGAAVLALRRGRQPRRGAHPRPARRTPLALANLIGEIRSTTPWRARVSGVGAGDPANCSCLTRPWPPISTAGEWNRAASRQQPDRDPRALNPPSSPPYRPA